MSVHKDGIVYYCGQPGHYIMGQEKRREKSVLRIDFGKFISGKKNYKHHGKQYADIQNDNRARTD